MKRRIVLVDDHELFRAGERLSQRGSPASLEGSELHLGDGGVGDHGLGGRTSERDH